MARPLLKPRKDTCFGRGRAGEELSAQRAAEEDLTIESGSPAARQPAAAEGTALTYLFAQGPQVYSK
jgi:hypothetical protein